jgi:hypothetical protein
MSQTLPVEIFEQVLIYLPFEKVIHLSDYVSKRIYNPKQHNLQMYIINGNLEAIKWIYKNNIDQFNISYYYYYISAKMIDMAAHYGHLHVVKFLTEKKVGKASFEAMNSSARSGHLELVKYLHYNRTEGCTKCAIDWAAENGHFEVVKFLCENRTEGFTKLAMYWVDRKKFKDIYDYLKPKQIF